MADKVIARVSVTHEIQDLQGLFSLLTESDQPIYIASDGIQGVLLRQQTYQALQDRLEDLEDLLAMREAEVEYRAGQGRSFDDIVAELEAEKNTDVSG
jgi:PHD/YefM family antitoxin component YafN of YafNO toxin-antitoxin module